MRVAVARAVMLIALGCMGSHRREWAAAMAAEFEVAAEAGDPLSFALGCLVAAWRELPAHDEGRFMLASHVLAVGVVLPVGSLLLASVARGFPLLALGDANTGSLLGSGYPSFPNTEANQAGLPLMAFFTIALGLGHLLMAWVMLDRDWQRAALIGRLGTAITATMLIFSSILYLFDACALPQAALIAVELIAVWTLVRWHADLPEAAPSPPERYRPSP